MPTYEFTCPEGHDFDKFFRSMATAPTVVDCPVCGKPAERQMSAGAGLVFHGSGFYITDYGKDGKKDQKAASSRGSDSTKAAAAGASAGDSASTGSESSGSGDSGSKAGDASASNEASKPAEPSSGASQSKTATPPAVKTPKASE